jgi:hypothetical protein
MADSKWQWIDNAFGPMGWFSAEEKARHEGTKEFSNGHWRSIPEEERASMERSIGRLAYEQA